MPLLAVEYMFDRQRMTTTQNTSEHRTSIMQRSVLTFRVFVSLTFSDLKVEWDALQRDMFPRLREYYQRHGCRFQTIDLLSRPRPDREACWSSAGHEVVSQRYGWMHEPRHFRDTTTQQVQQGVLACE